MERVKGALSPTDRIALECLKQIASEGRSVSQYEIAAAVGTKNVNGGTMAGIVKRLIEGGYIEHVAGAPLQKGLWLRIVETGHETAKPKNTTLHTLPLLNWREVEKASRDSTPTLPRHTIVQTVPTISTYLDQMMRDEGISYTQAQIVLMARGMQQREQEQ